MSKIGSNPIKIPANVKIEISESSSRFGGDVIKVNGPKGDLEVEMRRGIIAKVEEGNLIFTRQSNIKTLKSLHGLYRSLVNNAINGVITGYQKVLEIQGIGYKAEMKGQNISLKVGFSHPIEITPSKGNIFEVKDGLEIKVSGIDNQLVGHDAQRIQNARPPEPYKGKGIRFKGEVIRRKAGKTAASK